MTGHARLLDLLADRATQGLDPRESTELERLTLRFPEEDLEAFDRAAAALDLALAPRPAEPLPPALRARLEAESAARAASFAEQRRALLASQPDAIRRAWSATGDPVASGGAGGDVVWSTDAQAGFMRFRGLAVNDPSQQQYQLWIFDATRDERHPVDGGVFDVDTATGDVVVPIRAKLLVREPTLFAVTVERPGGVVVSSRERIALVAEVGS